MNIVYIAPEIPGLSSTFVYNEIFVLAESGQNIFPYTIHENIPEPKTEALAKLKAETRRLYGQGLSSGLKANLFCLWRYPARYLKTLCQALSDAAMNIRHPKIMLGIVYRFFVSGVLAKDLADRKVDHIHAHFAHFPGDIAMYCSGISGVPFSLTAHANDIFSNSWLLKQKSSRAAFIATISEYNKNYLSDLGCKSAGIQLVRCGVSTPETLESRPVARSTDNRIGFIGRLVEKKGLDVLLNACAILARQGVQFSLEIIGGGPLESEMQVLAGKLGVSDKVRFLGGIPNDQVIPWLSSLDVFVLPCVQDSEGDMDGIPVALMEAMLNRVPVISTELSGIPELVIHQKTGLLARPGDAENLSVSILALLQDEELGRNLSENAFLHVVDEFDARRNALRLLRLFQGQS